MRCASPPESVEARRSSVRYSRPTSLRNFRRWRISTRIFSAMAVSSGLRLQGEEKLLRLGDVHAHDIGQVLAVDADIERFLAQARALAIRAERVAAIAAEEDAHVHLVLLGLQVIEEAADELVERFALRRREIADRDVGADLGAVLLEIAEPGAVLGLGPRIDRAFVERKAGIRDHAVHVEIDGVAEALAARAGARRAS